MLQKSRSNPFIGNTGPSQEFPVLPTVSPWEWDLKNIVPNGRSLSFSACRNRPKLFQPILRALWVSQIDCIPAKGYGWIMNYRDKICRFAEYLDEHSEPAIRNLDSLLNLTREILLDYRKHVDDKYRSSTADKTYRLLVNLLVLLQSERSPLPGSVPANLEIPMKSLRRREEDEIIAQPYTVDQEAAIVAACKKACNRILERLTEAQKLLRDGKDPRLSGELKQPHNHKACFTTGWDSRANLLWYIVNVLGNKVPKVKEDTEELLIRYFYNPAPGQFQTKTEAYSFLYPTLADLVPFIILLQLKTGLNGDSIFALTRDCLLGAKGNKTTLQYIKGRGNYELLTRDFSHKGANSPIGLIKTVLQMTEALVPIAETKDKSNLWLAYHLKNIGKAHLAKPFRQNGFHRMVNAGYGTTSFMEANNLTDCHGNILRFGFKVGRKTNVTGEYLKHGNLALVSQKKLKHHGASGVNTTAFHYLTNEATHHVHNQTVRIAQDKLVKDAKRIVIAEEAPKKSVLANLVKKLSESEEKVLSILSGEQDVFIAACRDFYNKPGSVPNTPCSDPWACFTCANALWTSRILPRLINFKWFMEEQQKLLSLEDWRNKFDLPYAVITKDILPRFQERTIQWAKAEAKDSPFYVPPHLKEI